MSNPNRDAGASSTSRRAAGAALVAVALMAGAGQACANDDLAKTGTTDISLDGYCDVLSLTIFAWHQAGVLHTDCYGGYGVGAGMEGKVTGVSPKDLTLGEAWDDDTGTVYLWNIQYPLATGRSWSLFSTRDGANFSYVRGGTYTLADRTAATLTNDGPALHRAVAGLPPGGAATPMGRASLAGEREPGKAGTTYISLDGWCDVLVITVFPWHQAGEYTPSCNGESSTLGAGMEGKVTGVHPKDLTLGEVYYGFDDPLEIFLYNIQYPLATGQTWSVYGSKDGVNFSYVTGGTYTVTDAAAAHSVRVGPSLHDAALK